MRQDYVNARFLEWWSYHPRLLKDDIFPGWMKHECKIDSPVDKTAQMIREGYLRIGTPEEQLSQLKVDELKKIADALGLTAGKKKQDIINTILKSGNDTWKKSVDAAVAISDKGLSYLEKHCSMTAQDSSFIEEYLKKDFFGKITGVNFDKYFHDFEIQPGAFSLVPKSLINEIIHTDISKFDYLPFGLKPDKSVLYEIKRSLIWGALCGQGEGAVGAALSKVIGTDTKTACMMFRTLYNTIDSSYELSEMKNAGYKEYEYMSTNTEETCEICKALNGKVFPVSKAVIGVNCPPMHIGCRCTILAKIETVNDIQSGINRMLDSRSIEDIERDLDKKIAKNSKIKK